MCTAACIGHRETKELTCVCTETETGLGSPDHLCLAPALMISCKFKDFSSSFFLSLHIVGVLSPKEFGLERPLSKQYPVKGL